MIKCGQRKDKIIILIQCIIYNIMFKTEEEINIEYKFGRTRKNFK